MTVKVQVMRNQLYVAENCKVANRFWKRAVGLIGTKSLNSGEGLLLAPCNDIHMWFMSIPIDVVFVKRVSVKELSVTSVRKSIRPWKFLPVRDSRANETLELPVGTIDRCDIRMGDVLCIS